MFIFYLCYNCTVKLTKCLKLTVYVVIFLNVLHSQLLPFSATYISSTQFYSGNILDFLSGSLVQFSLRFVPKYVIKVNIKTDEANITYK
jgi:hypothetical protein